MNKNEYYTLKGYLKLLEHAHASGRHVHEVAQCIQVIRNYIYLDLTLPEPYLQKIKDTIHKLYP